MTHRLLGIDLGERRIGLAIGDTATATAIPFATIARDRTADLDAETLRQVISEQHVDGLVVGLPLDMAGTEGAQATRTREWAEAIGGLLGLPVTMHDERLSSERAERRMIAPRRGRSGGPPTAGQRAAFRGRIDREAAAIILQDAIDGMTSTAEAGSAIGSAEDAPGSGSKGDG